MKRYRPRVQASRGAAVLPWLVVLAACTAPAAIASPAGLMDRPMVHAAAARVEADAATFPLAARSRYLRPYVDTCGQVDVSELQGQVTRFMKASQRYKHAWVVKSEKIITEIYRKDIDAARQNADRAAMCSALIHALKACEPKVFGVVQGFAGADAMNRIVSEDMAKSVVCPAE